MAVLEVLPDASSIKTRFPEFTSVADAVIAFAIEEASLQVDDTWNEKEQMIAVSLLTAHLLSVAAASAGVDGREVVSETIGPISVTYAQAQAAASGNAVSEIESTAYGKRFKAMRRRNFGGPFVIS